MISYFRDEAEKVTTDPHDYPASVDGQGAASVHGVDGCLFPCGPCNRDHTRKAEVHAADEDQERPSPTPSLDSRRARTPQGLRVEKHFTWGGWRICISKIGPEETRVHRLQPRVLSIWVRA